MTPIERNWEAVPWTRNEVVLNPQTGAYRGEVGIEGAQVTDRSRGVTYRVTIGQGDGRGVWLRTLEVVPLAEGVAVDQPMLRRVPVAALAAYVAVALAGWKHAETAHRLAASERGEPEPGGLLQFVLPGGISLRDDGVPTSDELAAMLRAGETRHTIAARYSRAPSTVSDWIGRAYREVPELMPPRRRGRRPSQPTGATVPPDQSPGGDAAGSRRGNER